MSLVEVMRPDMPVAAARQAIGTEPSLRGLIRITPEGIQMATAFLSALPPAAPVPTEEVQRKLAHWNEDRLKPAFPGSEWEMQLARDHRMAKVEGAFLEALRDEVVDEAAAAPTDADGFIAWFEAL